MDDINEEIGLTNPIVLTPMIFVTIIRTEKIGIFSVTMLKTILHHFEVLFRAKDRNADLIRLVKDVIHECRCCK